VQQLFQGLLWHAERGTKIGCLLHQWEIFSRQALQREATFAALQDQFVLIRFQTHGLV
jgi:hypothetical protein